MPIAAPSKCWAQGSMPSSEAGLRRRARARARRAGLAMIALWLVVGAAWSPDARGQERPQGFATERFYPSAPGAGWMVMDNLDMHGGLAGAIAVSGGYARDPLRV